MRSSDLAPTLNQPCGSVCARQLQYRRAVQRAAVDISGLNNYGHLQQRWRLFCASSDSKLNRLQSPRPSTRQSSWVPCPLPDAMHGPRHCERRLVKPCVGLQTPGGSRFEKALKWTCGARVSVALDFSYSCRLAYFQAACNPEALLRGTCRADSPRKL